jgi:hypothetical protein
VLAGLEWKLLMEAFEATRAALPADGWLEIRYEDVVTDPRAEVGKLLDHLGLQWTDDFERLFSALEISPGRRDAYRDELPERDVELLQRALGPQLRAHGYTVPG